MRGLEATGYSRWFERLLAELGFEPWIGDPAQIKIGICDNCCGTGIDW
jgi:transposase